MDPAHRRGRRGGGHVVHRVQRDEVGAWVAYVLWHQSRTGPHGGHSTL